MTISLKFCMMVDMGLGQVFVGGRVVPCMVPEIK